jgi:hypothetical protein
MIDEYPINSDEFVSDEDWTVDDGGRVIYDNDGVFDNALEDD